LEKNKIIRLAEDEDARQMLDIYAPFITNSVITFENDVPAEKEFRERIQNIQKKYPWLVYEIDGKIAGYAYASPFHERAAYEWSVDLSIYVSPEFHGKGAGRSLYYALLEILKLQGFCNAVSLVTVPNEKSERLHKSFGFSEIGIYENIGYKFGWKSVRWLGLKINDYRDIPEVPRKIGEVKDSIEFKKIIVT
jgi:phosphinothricin acetyltransferase